MIYNKVKNEAVYDMTRATRATCKAEIEYPQSWEDRELAVYLGFCNAEADGVSNSICLFNGNYKKFRLPFHKLLPSFSEQDNLQE